MLDERQLWHPTRHWIGDHGAAAELAFEVVAPTRDAAIDRRATVIATDRDEHRCITARIERIESDPSATDDD